jgi:UDP-glucose 4-epimerase
MICLVTGCAGFIGSHLTEALLSSGHSVIGIDCFNDNYGRRDKLANLEVARAWNSFEFLPLDLSRGDLHDVVSEVDVVFHLAAEPGVRSSWGHRFDAYVRNNVLATHQLLEAVMQTPQTPVVYASSSSVYGQAEAFPTPESALPRPQSPYGMTKLSAEHLCQVYASNHGLRLASLRFFSVYGPRQRPDMAFRRFCGALVDGSTINVFGDGGQTRDFTFVGDIVEALRRAVDIASPDNPVINIGGGSQVALIDAIRQLEGISGRTASINFLETELGDVRDTGADTSRARAILGFAPQTPIGQGLAAEWDWVRESAEGVSRHRGRRAERA